MGFRDDFEATAKRAESLDRDLEKTRGELKRSEERLATVEEEEARLRGRLRSLGMPEEGSSQPTVQRQLHRGIGIVSIVLGLATSAFLYSVLGDWDAYIADDHVALTARGHEAHIALATYADTAEAIILAGMSILLVAIGIGLMFSHRWAKIASLLWATLALSFNVFTALVIDALHGHFTESVLLGAAVMTFFPVVLLVYGLWSTWRLIVPWTPRAPQK